MTVWTQVLNKALNYNFKKVLIKIKISNYNNYNITSIQCIPITIIAIHHITKALSSATSTP